MSTDRTLARAPRGDVGAERFQTPRILAGRHTDQQLVDHAPVQRVRIRECPGRWQRNLLAGAPRTGPTNRHLPPAQHNLTRRMPRSIRLARRLMRIPWPTDGGPILFQHGFEYLQARRDDHLLERGLRINEDRSGPRNLDSGLSEISIVFQAAVPKLVASKYTTSGVRRPSEL